MSRIAAAGLLVFFAAGLVAIGGAQENFFVSNAGSDANPGTESLPWRTVQHACNVLPAGATVHVKAGIYSEKVTVNVSGSQAAGFVTVRNYEDDDVVLDGTGVAGDNMFYLENREYVRIRGFEIRNNLDVSDGSGIRVTGWADHIELIANSIHDIRGSDAMGITVYGNSLRPIRHLVVDSNLVYDCDPAHSEALTLNGNVDSFQVTHNTVYGVNNIGIDFIGFEEVCPDSSQDYARHGICRWNTVYNCHSVYDSSAAGIYVDGASCMSIENNRVSDCDFGIEVGCEHRGKETREVLVANNLVYANDKSGIAFGGYRRRAGRVTDCEFRGNTCCFNDRKADGGGELLIQWSSNNLVRNNLLRSGPSDLVLANWDEGSSVDNRLDYNLWYGPPTASFVWNGEEYAGFEAYRTATGQDSCSLFADPRLVAPDSSPPDFRLRFDSPAVDRADPSFVADSGETDLDGFPRISGGRCDIGVYEYRSPAIEEAPAGRMGVADMSVPWLLGSGSSEVRFKLRAQARVRLGIYDATGRRLAVLADLSLPAGEHKAEVPARALPAGVCFCVLRAGPALVVRRAAVVR